MGLKQKLTEDMKQALKEKDDIRLSILRMALAAVINREIELGKKDEGLSDEEVLAILRSERKKREDSIAEFTRVGRNEMADKEKAEQDIIKEYLPAELSDEELQSLVQGALRETGASTINDFGSVMKAIMPKVAGRASGDRVSGLVRSLLK